MAYDEELADRVRAVLEAHDGLGERRMFGGLAFLLHGHLAVAVSGQGGLMVRCDPARAEEHTAHDGVARMEMQGRRMDGWLRVAPDVVADSPALAHWVHVGATYAASLPPK